MNICCIGDSLTEGDYGVYGKSGIANVHSENYPMFLAEYLGVRTQNSGKCGYTSTSYLKYYNDDNTDVSDADIIVVMLGTNGGFDAHAQTEGNRDFFTLLELLRRDAPKARIAVCTPPHVTKNPEYSGCGCAEKVEKAVEFIRKAAAEHSLAMIDTAQCGAFTAENESIMQPNDGVHFGKEGYRALAKFIGDGLKALYPDMF